MKCPTIEQLEQAAGAAPADEGTAPVRAHAAECRLCAERLAEMADNLVLAARLAGIPSAAPPTMPSPRPQRDGEPGPRGLPPLPGYTLIRELSRGGQGVVYQAIQQSTKRRVAIKVLRAGHFADARERARFEREIHILGQLKHPSVVTIYDSGSVDENLYYVMDYVAGAPLDEWVKEHSLSVYEIFRLFATVCDAVHAAHLRGIIHRDLKPSNIRIDEDGHPHVLDFGLAKTAGEPDAAAMTQTGQFLGSLPWSSPEQAEGQPSRIDIRSDVYSLGVVLYQLLTGRFPYDVSGNMRDVLDRIVRLDPARPSAVIASASGSSVSLVHHLASWLGDTSALDDEADTIVLKCLQKDRERRYQSAGELARDIRHYLVGEPIEAKRDSAAYLLRKAVYRYRLPAVVTALLLATVTAGLGFSLAAHRRAAEERDRARAAEKRKVHVLAFLADMLGAANPLSARVSAGSSPAHRLKSYYAGRSGQVATVLEVLAEAGRRLDYAELDPLVEAELRYVLGKTLAESGQFEPAIAQLKRAVHLHVLQTGYTSPESLASQERLVYALSQAGDHDQALQIAGRLYQLLSPARGPGEAMTCAFAVHAANALQARNRGPEAIRLLQTQLDAAVAAHGAQDEQVVELQFALARVWSDSGKAAESLAINQTILKTFVGRKGSLPYLRAAEGVADALYDLGRYREAARAGRVAVDSYRAEYGEDHPATAFQKVYLARSLGEIGELAAARRVAEAALDCHRRFGGDEHPDTYRAERCLARILAFQGAELERAETLARHAARGYQRVREPAHYDVLYANDAIAAVLQRQGRLAEAETIFRKNIELGQSTPETLVRARMLRGLGACLRERGQHEQAEEWLLAAWACVEGSFSLESDLADQVARELLSLYEDCGNVPKIEEWAARVALPSAAP